MAEETIDANATASADGGRAALERQLPFRLLVIHSVDPRAIGHSLQLSRPVAVGREGADLALTDRKMSRTHATFARVRGGGACRVTDHGSKNGTFVAGVRVAPDKPVEVGDGGLVRLGDTLFVVERIRPALAQPAPDPSLVGYSVLLAEVRHKIHTVARSTIPVLLQGETGTGKEVVARRIHAASGRVGRFVPVNCAAIPDQLVESYLFGHKRGAFTGATSDAEGYVAAAEGGTLFLDEIGELPLMLQPKLLRVLETREYSRVGSTAVHTTDARIVAATNVDLKAEVSADRFRLDLYARLAGFPFKLPPLRARRPDIPLLFEHFRRLAAPDWQPIISGELMERLVLHPWPMNVRELKTLVERLSLLYRDRDRLELDDAPEDLLSAEEPGAGASSAAKSKGGAPSREELEGLLRAHEGNVGRVARELGKHRTQIYRWLERHQLSADDYR